MRTATYGSVSFVGASAAARQVMADVETAARSEAKVLITGETGVGKDVVARLLHLQSARRHTALSAINCAGMPDTLLESELFGHVRGSFTGAFRDKVGLLEAADRGTAFLDEAGEMSARMQGVLLRFLETGEVQRVGSERGARVVNVRIIAATNRDLEKAVAEGSFREDLYYRLDVIPIKLPPLRMRTSDIPLLTQHFLEKFAKESGKPVPTMNQEAMRVLLAHEWRGNVRELENVIERVVAFTTGSSVTEADIRGWLHKSVSTQQVLPSDLPEDGLDLERLIDSIEKDLLLKALERSQWVKKRAARLLRLNTRSFRYRLEKYEIKGGRD